MPRHRVSGCEVSVVGCSRLVGSVGGRSVSCGTWSVPRVCMYVGLYAVVSGMLVSMCLVVVL